MKALTVSNLHKTYKNNVVALSNINFSVNKGEFFALLGPNGAGKSTSIGIISSLVNKNSGEITIFGHSIDKKPEQVKSYIGLVPQEFNLNIFRECFSIVVNQAGYYGISKKIATKKAEDLFKKLGLWEKRHQIVRTLSGGMKRKLMIIRALIHEPKLLILDEPTAGVDVETRRQMWAFLQELNESGVTIILTTHYLEEAEQLCKNITIIDKGKVVKQTSVKELLSSMDTEIFILDIKNFNEPIKSLVGFDIEKIDNTTIQVSIKKDQNFNNVITHLNDQNIEIMSMRNKANRLEELFINLTKQNNVA